MIKKTILLSIDWYLPGTNSGGPVRSFSNLIDSFKDKFIFFIITRNHDYASTETYKGIESNKWIKRSKNLNIIYLSKEKLSFLNLINLYKEVEYDYFWINGVYSLYFSVFPLIYLKMKKEVGIVSARGMLNPQAFSVKPLRKRFYLLFSNCLGLFDKIKFHATNESEKTYINKHLGKNKSIFIAPNIPSLIQSKNKTTFKSDNTIRMVSVARISKEKGTLKLLRKIINIKQKIKLDLYGPVYDHAYWNQCKKIIQKSSNNISINYNGIISYDKLPKTLIKYDFFILFTEGENFGHSIFESFSAGLPVITSLNTPWRQLKNKRIGWDIDIDNFEFEKTINEIINMSKEEYYIWSLNCINFSEKYIENMNLKQSYLKLLEI
ncbi:MAG: hypothetical protein CMK44_00480 [Porticoccus sp.]|nr:hypothetical protein [Porticoccus sp.]